MSFFDDLPPFISSSPPYASAPLTDAIVLSGQPQSPSDDHDQSPTFKRSTTTFSESNNNHSNELPYPPRMRMMHPQNNNNNNNRVSNKLGTGTGHIFFKTRMCTKFRLGSCRNGENCNFAHGIEDMRQPPPNWQELVGLRGSNEEQHSAAWNWDDDQKIILKMKLCKKYCNGEECPYGERCSFLHEEPSKFRDDSVRIRESSVIRIGTNESPKSNEDGYDYNNSETDKAVVMNNVGLNAYRGKVRSTFWKTKLCIKWETTGQCPFGEGCHFAHGQSELQVLGGHMDTEAASSIIPIATYATIPTLPKVTSVPVIDDAPPLSNIASAPPLSNIASAPPLRNIARAPLANEVEPGKKSLLKWKGPKKINQIYADWIDDVPLE
ncbi:putative transcription factor C3H family [Lupinus albus]|uniref:Putative transcription factor C3H family n=1 Tax=Lupinus albus TaxID=3870 RepID=A0A6A4PJZ4_LUPAL|nr:putative transcription factor C3H family [Lupinus albus]